jgi:hypothetical protein
MAFWQFISQNMRKTARFLPFLYILGGLEGLFDFYDPLHHHPWTGHSPDKSRRGRGMTQSLPLSYWSPEKLYMTSSHMATLIYIAAWFRVNSPLSHIERIPVSGQ